MTGREDYVFHAGRVRWTEGGGTKSGIGLKVWLLSARSRDDCVSVASGGLAAEFVDGRVRI